MNSVKLIPTIYRALVNVCRHKCGLKSEGHFKNHIQIFCNNTECKQWLFSQAKLLISGHGIYLTNSTTSKPMIYKCSFESCHNTICEVYSWGFVCQNQKCLTNRHSAGGCAWGRIRLESKLLVCDTCLLCTSPHTQTSYSHIPPYNVTVCRGLVQLYRLAKRSLVWNSCCS